VKLRKFYQEQEAKSKNISPPSLKRTTFALHWFQIRFGLKGNFV